MSPFSSICICWYIVYIPKLVSVLLKSEKCPSHYRSQNCCGSDGQIDFAEQIIILQYVFISKSGMV